MHLYFLRGNILNLSETLHIFLHFRVGEKTEVFTVCAHDKKRTGNDIAVQAAVAVHAVQLCFVIADKERTVPISDDLNQTAYGFLQIVKLVGDE